MPPCEGGPSQILYPQFQSCYIFRIKIWDFFYVMRSGCDNRQTAKDAPDNLGDELSGAFFL